MFLDLLISGLLAGSLYALVALGMVVIFKATDVVNFAQGEMVMAGGYLGYLFRNVLAWTWTTTILAVLACSLVLGLLLERVANRPLMRAQSFTVIVASIALGIILRNIARVIWTDEVYALAPVLSGQPVARLAGVRLTAQNLFVLLSAVALVAALYGFFQTKLGKAMQAVQQNRTGAELVGIELPAIFALTWGISALLAGAAGFLLAPLVGVSPAMGWIAVKAFVAAIIGGFSSIPGTIVGGFVVGVVENLAGGYISTAMKDIVTYAILIGVLMVRPHGLLGQGLARRA